MKKIFTLIFVVMSALIMAQAPESFNYQAVVRDANGNVLSNTQVTFQFDILSGSTSGTVVYSEEHSATTNEYGLVNLKIGEGTVLSGDFSSIDWGVNTYFLNIKLDQGGGLEDLGTQQFVSVPYALYAKTAGNAGGTTYTAGNGISITGNVIENTMPDQEVTITGTGTTTVSGTYPNFTISSNDADSDPSNELQVLNISNDTLYLSNGGQVYLGGYSNYWTRHGNNIYYNSGHVGVGTDAPGGPLVVKADTSLDPDSALFEVKNKDGQTVFAVYDGGVRVYVAKDTSANKDNVRTHKMGFAVGGLVEGQKSTGTEYLRVTPDSTRIWTGDPLAGFGVRSLDDSTETSYMHLTPNNYFIGENAGVNITTGLYNTTFGYGAGYSLTNGSSNILIGYKAGYLNTSGTHNLIIGNDAGYNISSGSYNIFLGTGAAGLMTYSAYSMNLGINSGHYLNSEYSSTFVGTNSGLFLYASSGNTLIGTDCGRGGSNVDSVTTYYNTIIGTSAGYNISSASRNTIIGYKSGFYLHTGTDNVFIGYKAGYNETGSNKLYISNSETSSPLIFGDFSSGKVTINDVLKLPVRSSAPSSPTEGEIYVGTDHHIYCYLNGTWKQLDN